MLESKIILVTHVCHFTGPSLLPELLAQGANVVCHDTSFADSNALAEFRSSNPDVTATDAQSPEDIVSAAIDAHGRIDVLIANDSYPAVRAPLVEADLDELRSALDALIVTPFALAQAVVPHFRNAGHGKILFITSAAPLRGIPNYAMYVAGRGGANALAQTLAQELARDNIVVNAIAPNYVENPDYFPPELLANEEALARMTANIPLGRLGKPHEIAGTIAFLASDAANFMTGMVVPFAGGWA